MNEVKLRFKFALILVLFFGCKQSEEKKTLVQTSEDGVVVSEISYLNDTIMHGLAKYYYKNGMLKEEINYDSGLVDGDYIRYYEDGKVKSRVKFKRGLREGVSEWYFQNGKVGKLITWMNNKRFGSSIFYYESGSIEAYNCFDFQEHNRYLIKYDSRGIKVKEEGTVLGQLLYDVNLDSIHINKPVVLKISVAVPPNRIVNVTMEKLTWSELKEVIQLPVENNVVVYRETFSIKGKYTLITIGEMKDKQGTVLKRDSIRTDITVID